MVFGDESHGQDGERLRGGYARVQRPAILPWLSVPPVSARAINWPIAQIGSGVLPDEVRLLHAGASNARP